MHFSLHLQVLTVSIFKSKLNEKTNKQTNKKQKTKQNQKKQETNKQDKNLQAYYPIPQT